MGREPGALVFFLTAKQMFTIFLCSKWVVPRPLQVLPRDLESLLEVKSG